jgi:hypothetical protein
MDRGFQLRLTFFLYFKGGQTVFKQAVLYPVLFGFSWSFNLTNVNYTSLISSFYSWGTQLNIFSFNSMKFVALKAAEMSRQSD